jgi:hypothetical protein
MQNEFGFLVCPIGFNINIKMSGNFGVLKGFGSPELNNLQPGAAVKLSTEFPSYQNEQGEKKPGPYLFLLKPHHENAKKFATKWVEKKIGNSFLNLKNKDHLGRRQWVDT